MSFPQTLGPVKESTVAEYAKVARASYLERGSKFSPSLVALVACS